MNALRHKLEEIAGDRPTIFVSPSAMAVEIGGAKFVVTVEKLPCECSSCVQHNQ